MRWTEFAAAAPTLAQAGRDHLYQWDIGLAFLATVRPDGGPRVHPVCPIINDDGLLVLVVPGPKQRDLLRDGRYALHSETLPPPREDDGFHVTGRAVRVGDDGVRERFHVQLAAERGWEPSEVPVNDDVLFELHLDTALLMQTRAGDAFPAGPTVWHAPPLAP